VKYQSTRGKCPAVTAAQAIQVGIAPDGGLFVPDAVPKLDASSFDVMQAWTYQERACYILQMYLPDFTAEDIKSCVYGAYNQNSFDSPEVAPLREIIPGLNILELWHGPTCAFKDMALQMLPHLLTLSVSKNGEHDEIVILVATSGDTGKAALEGFKDVKGTRIIVFFPRDGVSEVQKRQMITQEGNNVSVAAVKGNFDDAQNGVKNIFASERVVKTLADSHMKMSSANSINWGRLLPQIVYYVSSYLDILAAGKKAGEPVNVVVPTGNFGNILAAYYARQMGVPIKKLICASNSNNVLTDFLRTGIYNRNRHFYKTMSPSMDILISSNLERLLYLRFGSERTAAWMKQLLEKGEYALTKEDKSLLDTQLTGGWCDEEQTAKTIRDMFDSHHYLADTHTAVALHAARERTTQDLPLLVLSTASPYKFPVAVYASLTGRTLNDDFEALGALSHYTGTTIPSPIASLHTLPVRFQGTVDKADMKKMVLAG
jgi:threonine synthase